MGSFSSNLFRRNIITLIMIAKITLVSCLAAIAMAAPEPQLGYGLAGGVVSSVPAACTPSTEEIEIQSCAPTAENVCSTADVVSEEINYEKRCKEVVNKHCAHIGGYAHAGLVGHVVKREADAEADAQYLGYGGLHHGLGYADMPTPPPLPSPSPPPSPRPLRLPALRSPPNIALMSQLSRRSSPPSRLATLSPRLSAHPPSTSSPRSLVKPELPKLSNTPSSPTMELTLTADKHLKPKSFKTAI